MNAFKLLAAASMFFFIHAANSYAASFTTDGSAARGAPGTRYSIYQNPDGSYPSLSNFVRDINGVPCGVECEADADRRWGVRPQRNDRGAHDYYGFYAN